MRRGRVSGSVRRQGALRGLAAVALVVGAVLGRPMPAAGRSPARGAPLPLARGGAATPRKVEGTGTVLRGLGKETGREVDAKQDVDGERAAWEG